MTERREVIVAVTDELLPALFGDSAGRDWEWVRGLPPDAEFVHLLREFHYGQTLFRFRSASFAVVPEGGALPRLDLLVRKKPAVVFDETPLVAKELRTSVAVSHGVIDGRPASVTATPWPLADDPPSDQLTLQHKTLFPGGVGGILSRNECIAAVVGDEPHVVEGG